MIPFAGHSFLVLTIALALDALIGDPDWLWRHIPHPVVLMGRLIDWLDRTLNRAEWEELRRKMAGVAALTILILLAGGVGYALEALFGTGPAGVMLDAIAASTLLAQRSLYDHVKDVCLALNRRGLLAGRRAVSMIVGRDPNSLDEPGVCRAAIETTAENLSDGVVAPVFWFLIAGLPGIIIYKAVNTADSMIGHRTPRHEAFGWAAARLDDWLNLIPARLSALLIVLAAFLARADCRAAWAATRRDARRHRSPNAGWPEAAMAGALGLALAGPRIYASGRIEDAWMNEGGRNETRTKDIARALRLFVIACWVEGLAVALLAFIFG